MSEIYVPIMWLNDNPVIDGARYFGSMDEAIEFTDRHKLQESNIVKWTICTMRKGELPTPNQTSE